MAADMQAGITPEFFAHYSLAQLRALSPRELEACGRLIDAVYAGPGDTHYRLVGWDEALARVAATAEAQPARPHLLLRQRPVVQRSRLPAAALRPAVRHELRQQLLVLLPPGQRRRPRRQPRHRHGHRARSRMSSTADLFVLIGGNPASNHPRLMRSLMTIRRRGGHVIVINPLEGSRPRQLPRARPMSAEPAVRLADRQPLRAAAHRRRHRAADRHREARARTRRPRRAFIDAHTEGFDALRHQVAATPWERDRVARRASTASDDRRASAELYWPRRTSSSAGRWASRITCTASRTCR